MTRSFLKIPEKSEVFGRRPKFSEVLGHINANSLLVLFKSKIRDCEEGIVIYSFLTCFSFLGLHGSDS